MQRVRHNTHPPWANSTKSLGPSLQLRTREKRLGELEPTMQWIWGKEYSRNLVDFVSGQLMFHTHYWHPEVEEEIVANNYGEIHFVVKNNHILYILYVPHDYYFSDPTITKQSS